MISVKLSTDLTAIVLLEISTQEEIMRKYIRNLKEVIAFVCTLVGGLGFSVAFIVALLYGPGFMDANIGFGDSALGSGAFKYKFELIMLFAGSSFLTIIGAWSMSKIHSPIPEAK